MTHMTDDEVMAAIIASDSARDADRRDAERYRWLKNQWGELHIDHQVSGETLVTITGKFEGQSGLFNEIIDKAMAVRQ